MSVMNATSRRCYRKLTQLTGRVIQSTSILSTMPSSSVRSLSSNAMTPKEAEEANGTSRMNLFTAINEGMRVAMQTDESAVSDA